jgi:DNA repair protein RecO
MSYHVYSTEGIILKRTPFGEGNLILHVLTKEFGLVIGSARSVRLSKSKLRPSLQEYSLVLLSMVKGKNGWKITNASQTKNYFFDSPKFSHHSLAQISSLLLKTITGELPHKEIFETVKSGFDYFSKIKESEVKSLEILTVLRILYELGYVVKDEKTEKFLNNLLVWSEDLFSEIENNKISIVGLINNALKESQL